MPGINQTGYNKTGQAFLNLFTKKTVKTEDLDKIIKNFGKLIDATYHSPDIMEKMKTPEVFKESFADLHKKIEKNSKVITQKSRKLYRIQCALRPTAKTIASDKIAPHIKRVDDQIEGLRGSQKKLKLQIDGIKTEIGKLIRKEQFCDDAIRTWSEQQFADYHKVSTAHLVEELESNCHQKIEVLDGKIMKQKKEAQGQKVCDFVRSKTFLSFNADRIIDDSNKALSGEKPLSSVTSDEYLIKNFGYELYDGGGNTRSEKRPNDNGLKFRRLIENVAAAPGAIKKLEAQKKVVIADYDQEKKKLFSPTDVGAVKHNFEILLDTVRQKIDDNNEKLTSLSAENKVLSEQVETLENEKKSLEEQDPGSPSMDDHFEASRYVYNYEI